MDKIRLGIHLQSRLVPFLDRMPEIFSKENITIAVVNPQLPYGWTRYASPRMIDYDGLRNSNGKCVAMSHCRQEVLQPDGGPV